MKPWHVGDTLLGDEDASVCVRAGESESGTQEGCME